MLSLLSLAHLQTGQGFHTVVAAGERSGEVLQASCPSGHPALLFASRPHSGPRTAGRWGCRGSSRRRSTAAAGAVGGCSRDVQLGEHNQRSQGSRPDVERLCSEATVKSQVGSKEQLRRHGAASPLCSVEVSSSRRWIRCPTARPWQPALLVAAAYCTGCPVSPFHTSHRYFARSP